METRTDLKCSFCGKSSRQVEWLLMEHGRICICDECVDLCVVILAEKRTQKRNEVEIERPVAKRPPTGEEG